MREPNKLQEDQKPSKTRTDTHTHKQPTTHTNAHTHTNARRTNTHTQPAHSTQAEEAAEETQKNKKRRRAPRKPSPVATAAATAAAAAKTHQRLTTQQWPRDQPTDARRPRNKPKQNINKGEETVRNKSNTDLSNPVMLVTLLSQHWQMTVTIRNHILGVLAWPQKP